MTPDEMNRFVDRFPGDSVGVHFDTGNIMQFQFPEHWIRQCGKRIRNVHLKEYSKQAGTEFTLESFRPLPGRHHKLARCTGGVRVGGVPGLSDVRVLPPLPALAGGVDSPDGRLTPQDAGALLSDHAAQSSPRTIRRYPWYRSRAISPRSTADFTAHPVSCVWEQSGKRQLGT